MSWAYQVFPFFGLPRVLEVVVLAGCGAGRLVLALVFIEGGFQAAPAEPNGNDGSKSNGFNLPRSAALVLCLWCRWTASCSARPLAPGSRGGEGELAHAGWTHVVLLPLALLAVAVGPSAWLPEAELSGLGWGVTGSWSSSHQ